MQYFEMLLEQVDIYNAPTLWNQMVEVNQPKFKDIDENLYRIISELYYLYKNNCEARVKIEKVSKQIVENRFVVTDIQLNEYENSLIVYQNELKKQTIHLVSHAHIDMNWMWGYQETVDVLVGTIETMLSLMDRYPEFTYSHSQGATYKILERYRPDLIVRIKEKIRAKQFEVSATTWTENDRNMTNLESYLDHFNHTRMYLKHLLGLEDDDFVLDFEPDCFGHSAEIPKILSQAGIKYYYHCRGLENQDIYRWESDSGHRILSFFENRWYSNSINPLSFTHIPQILKKHRISDMLFVYGVGDHGGGPTIRDIEMIEKMKEYPIYPTVKFSTYKQFFETIEEHQFPIVKGEHNFTLNGCFTSSSRMKYINKHGENIRGLTRFSDTICQFLLNEKSLNSDDMEADCSILFNQFHDILPGCGTLQTREYATGEFQKALAHYNSKRKSNYTLLGKNIDTSFVKANKNNSRTFGAGQGTNPLLFEAGLGISTNIYLSQNSVTDKDVRYYTAYNASPYQREEVVDVLVWDFNAKVENIIVVDSMLNKLVFVVDNADYSQYWGHFYTRLKIRLVIPGFGYNTFAVYEGKSKVLTERTVTDERINKKFNYILENDNVKLIFDPITMQIKKFYHKEQLLAENLSFVMRQEEGCSSNAWVCEKIVSKKIQNNAFNMKYNENILCKTISYCTKFNNTDIEVKICLEGNNSEIKFEVNTLFNEVGSKELIPNLVFSLDKEVDYYVNDIAGGRITRSIKNEDICGLNYIYSNNLYISSQEKYGYIVEEGKIIHNLIRATTSPDTHPENYHHKFKFNVGYTTEEDLDEIALKNHTLIEVINIEGGGNLAPSGKLCVGASSNLRPYSTQVIGSDIYIKYIATEDCEVNHSYDIYFNEIEKKLYKKGDIVIYKIKSNVKN